MRFTHFAFATVLAVLFASTFWACNRDHMQNSPTVSAQGTEQLSPQAMPASGAGMMQRLRADCPMVVQGTDVAASDTEGGVALAFTTDAPDVADLRTRVRSMAQMYEMHRGHGVMLWQHMGSEDMSHGSDMGMEHTAESGRMPAASSTVTDTDEGAHLELRPTDPAQLDALRQHVRLHQQRMHSGECWMLQEQHPAQDGQE